MVVLSAAIGEYEEGFSVEIENILSMNRLENKPMICVINKMDITNPEYSQERFLSGTILITLSKKKLNATDFLLRPKILT